jgi:diguanylate cyclase (GGDEF)-like protein
MELALWRWSTAVQLSSAALIALFFGVLARSLRTAELRLWLLAWLANLAALGVTLALWYLRPGPELGLPARFASLVGKAAFVALLIEGAFAMRHPGRRRVRRRLMPFALALYALLGGLLLGSVDLLGVFQHGVLGLLLLAAGVALAVRRPLPGGFAWLAVGFVARALLSLGEAAAHAVQLLPSDAVAVSLRQDAVTFLAAHSAFDSGAEWLLALGCVLALSERTQRELRQANQELLAAQQELRSLVDRDPLTGLVNRRALPALLRSVQPVGATLLFFDLDDFKETNDLHGHAVGDECLRRFARELVESFRPDDAVVRYGGDEFLVVAPIASPDALAGRVERLRDRLRGRHGTGPAIGFSVGLAQLAPEGDPEAALRAADHAMYAAKPGRSAPGAGD